MNYDKQLMAFAISALRKPPLLTLADAARELRQIKAAAANRNVQLIAQIASGKNTLSNKTSRSISKRGRS